MAIRSIILILLVGLLSCKSDNSSTRVKNNFDNEWKFAKGDHPNASSVDYDATQWRDVNLPHDWSIEGPFQKDAPALSRGAYRPTGIAWYRKEFQVDKKWKGQKVFIDFEGVYMNSEVWINGHYLGKRPFGYISFQYDLSSYIQFGKKNVIAVKTDTSRQPGGRWYNGAGIYRHVWLTTTGKVYVKNWGTTITTNIVDEKEAFVQIRNEVINEKNRAEDIEVKTEIYDAKGHLVGSSSVNKRVEKNKEVELIEGFTIEKPILWSLENPHLYSAKVKVLANGKLIDESVTRFGIRTIEFTADKGFLLNGKQVKLKGVCLHHDNGALGAAAIDRAKQRQVDMLKEMGCNAIRTSHNPASPAFLNYCDEVGMLVMEESFDEWATPKRARIFDTEGNKSIYQVKGYAKHFKKWSKKDLADMVRRDRNHPSIILWSVGNEIPEAHHANGAEIMKPLVDVCHNEDPTRPVTCGVLGVSGAHKNGMSALQDVVGYNYKPHMFKADYEKYHRPMVATEDRSSAWFYGRETYYLPNESGNWRNWPKNGKRGLCKSRNDSQTGERAWILNRDCEQVAGIFIWTGWDYLGEATPYSWPYRSSMFGVIDLAGFPKDSYYMYQSEWTNKDVLHLFPHWNWEGKEGQTIPVKCFTNCDEVELFVNGKSAGIRRQKDDPERLLLQWDVPFAKGEIKVIGKRNGKVVMENRRVTTGDAYTVRLTPDRKTIHADGVDLCYIKAEIVDQKGNVVPTANNTIQFNIEGNASIVGVDNGDPASHHDFQGREINVYNGRSIVIVQAGKQAGQFNLIANSINLKENKTEVTMKQ
ncbi:glycoside hydrolase family 2 protein [Prolixibacteraceae bacterium JC049]|nr:glycoside hydrolase family 2 protein [Prolixibacteraceae bacterium JC049]